MLGEWLAIIMFVVFLVAILSGYPVAFSFAGTGVVFFFLGILTGDIAFNAINGLFSKWFAASMIFSLPALSTYGSVRELNFAIISSSDAGFSGSPFG